MTTVAEVKAQLKFIPAARPEDCDAILVPPQMLHEYNRVAFAKERIILTGDPKDASPENIDLLRQAWAEESAKMLAETQVKLAAMHPEDEVEGLTQLIIESFYEDHRADRVGRSGVIEIRSNPDAV